MSEWIPVKDQLPKEDEVVLVTIEDLDGFDNIKRSVRIGKYFSRLGSLDSYRQEWQIEGEGGINNYRRITAWKPLDEPYVPPKTKYKWISAKDRLPEHEQDCIILFYAPNDSEPTYAFAWLNNCTHRWIEMYSGYEYGNDLDIKAWAEIPKWEDS